MDYRIAQTPINELFIYMISECSSCRVTDYLEKRNLKKIRFGWVYIVWYLFHALSTLLLLRQEKCNELLKVLTTKICINGYFIIAFKISYVVRLVKT